MRTNRHPRGHTIAAFGGAALTVGLWLPWYAFRIPGAAIDSAEQLARQAGALGPILTHGVQLAQRFGPLHVDAWQVYTAMPAVLCVCAAVGGGLALMSATGWVTGVSQLVQLAGGVGALLIVLRLVAPPMGGLLLHPTWGLFIALGGSLAMLAGGAIGGRDEDRSSPEPDWAAPTSGHRWSTIHSVPPPASS